MLIRFEVKNIMATIEEQKQKLEQKKARMVLEEAKLKKQYRKIQEDWKYIRRYNDTTRCLSKSAQDILFSALYQINKYGHAVLTHYELSKLTGAKCHQNRRIVNQLGFILDFTFERSVILEKRKYMYCYVFSKNENTDEILENPKKFFSKILKKNAQMSVQKKTKEVCKNAQMSVQKCSDVCAKMLSKNESLHIYTKNKDKINDNKDNQNQFHNSNLVSSNSENVETLDSKIETTENVEKSEKLLAKEVLVSCNAVLKIAILSLQKQYLLFS